MRSAALRKIARLALGVTFSHCGWKAARASTASSQSLTDADTQFQTVSPVNLRDKHVSRCTTHADRKIFLRVLDLELAVALLSIFPSNEERWSSFHRQFVPMMIEADSGAASPKSHSRDKVCMLICRKISVKLHLAASHFRPPQVRGMSTGSLGGEERY